MKSGCHWSFTNRVSRFVLKSYSTFVTFSGGFLEPLVGVLTETYTDYYPSPD